MNKELVTIDTILDWFKSSIEQKLPIRPVEWLDSSAKLIILSQDLDEEIAGLECDIADEMAKLIREDMSVSQAKSLANSGEVFRKLKKRKAVKERVISHVQIAKKRTELNEY